MYAIRSYYVSVKVPGLFIPSWRAENWKRDEFVDLGEQTADAIDISADAKGAVERHILTHEKNGTYELNPDMIASLEQMVTLCKQHSVTVITSYSIHYTKLYDDVRSAIEPEKL